jgi:hypothetical protein
MGKEAIRMYDMVYIVKRSLVLLCKTYTERGKSGNRETI